MKRFINKTAQIIVAISILSIPALGQSSGNEIVVSGARFTTSLFEHWIAEYQKLHPDANFRIENKGSAEYSTADITIHGHKLDKSEIDKNREYISIAKYAIVPVANAQSLFAETYGEKGLSRDELKQAFFYDPIGQEKVTLKIPFNVYTRVQKAPSPTAFAANFGYSQQDIHGRAIAGTDIHLIMSVLRDPQGITYAPLALIYSPETGKPQENLKVIPVDFDDNGKVSENERFYDDLNTVLKNLEDSKSKNVPVVDIQVSIVKENPKPESVQFLQWILEKGQESLKQYGYLKADIKIIEKDKALLGQLVTK